MDETLPIDIDDDDEEMMAETAAAVELKKNKRNVEIANNLVEEKARKLARTLDNSNYEPIFNSKSKLDNWAKKKREANNEFQTNYIEQSFAA